jgi:hypothetical protein
VERWSGGVVEWWSGGVVEWWSGGVVEWWSETRDLRDEHQLRTGTIERFLSDGRNSAI